MGLYDPNLSEAELFNRVGEVLDHETTHALKEMNVITPAEWKTLTDAAAKMRYTKIKSGKKQQRKVLIPRSCQAYVWGYGPRNTG